MTILVEMSNIAKSFGGTAALKGVSLALAGGSVHALMGENGAGKSTLMKILAGVHQPDGGTISRDGRAVSFGNPADALDAGISTVFQELSLLPNLSIAENMFLGREPTTRLGRVDYARMNEEARRALAELGLSLDPGTLVSELSIAERQFVEIAHGIKADASVFILDEPTAALNAADVEILNRHIRRLKGEGKAVVYISHRMDEIFAICDTVTVLKDGALVGTRPLSEMTPATLIAMMVGRELAALFPPRGAEAGEEVLALSGLRVTERSKPLSLSLRRGEIVALAGLEGQGQQKILRALVGQYAPVAGQATVKGKPFALPASAASGVRAMQARGVGFVPEDRKEDGLFLGLSIAHNISAALYSMRSELSIAGSYQRLIADVMQRLQVKAAGPGAPAGTLSGGNQQKVLLGRYLAAEMDVLLIEEPTRGVDIGAKAEIYRLLREFADRGGAILVLSRETVELIGLCDRILVVHGDTIVAEMPAAAATEHNILDAALSA
ncbi:MAG: sugar ABC transporter ATP-binding protein [Rhizobiaceae bacterium]|nr:sugar ABC transporter ATP-binding protein [Rhizobiaceae bacterium]